MALDYKKDMQIDPSALDVEWVRQPEIGRRYALHAAAMRKAANLAEERTKIVRSELIRKVKEDPEGTTGSSKPTAMEIEAYYRTQPEHLKAKEEWIEAVYEADYAEMAQKEISYGRKAALENLVALYAAQYFAGPNVPRNLEKEIAKRRMSDASNESVNSALKRNK